VRPQVADIAIPPLPPDLAWVGVRRAPPIDALAAAGPVLVHFFDLAQVNSVRTLPYLRAWRQRYAEEGVAVLGVHTPRFPFTMPRRAVAAAVRRLEIPYPVAVDCRFRAWRAYGCEGWPSLFLWGRGGALRWFHFGEGEYRATEEVLQELVLEARPHARLPEPLPPLRASDAPGALVMAPTDELFPGGSAERPWEAKDADPALELEYEAGEAFAAADGEGALELELDRRPADPIAVDGPGLYEIALHDRHEQHRLRLRPSAGVRVWSVSFAAGVP
jgi:hypothetical protein